MDAAKFMVSGNGIWRHMETVEFGVPSLSLYIYIYIFIVLQCLEYVDGEDLVG